MDGTNPFETDLERGPANHVPLSPLSFLPRAAAVYPGRCAVVHGETRYTWAEVYERCRRLASALSKRSEEHTSELQSLMRISYAVYCLKKKHNAHLKVMPPRIATRIAPLRTKDNT